MKRTNDGKAVERRITISRREHLAVGDAAVLKSALRHYFGRILKIRVVSRQAKQPREQPKTRPAARSHLEFDPATLATIYFGREPRLENASRCPGTACMLDELTRLTSIVSGAVLL